MRLNIVFDSPKSMIFGYQIRLNLGFDFLESLIFDYIKRTESDRKTDSFSIPPEYFLSLFLSRLIFPQKKA